MFVRNRMLKPVAALMATVMLVATPAAVFAATPQLVEIAPADTLMYIEWHGAESFLDGEHPFPYQALVDSIANINPEDEDFAKWVPVIGMLVETIWTSPTSLSLHDVAIEDRGPDIQAVLVIATPRAAKLLELLHGFAQESRQRIEQVQIGGVSVSAFPDDITLYALAHKDHLVLSVSETAVKRTLDGINGTLSDPLAKDEEFKFVFGKMAREGQKRAVSMFVNAQRFIKRANAIAVEMSGGDIPPIVGQVIEEAGFNDVKSKGVQLVWADGAWRLSGYVHAPSPRKGIIKLFDQPPVKVEDYEYVPADAFCFATSNFDLHGAYNTILDAAGKINEGWPPAVNNLVVMSTGMIGVNVVNDLLAQTDGRLTVYDAPSHGGMFFTGMAIVIGSKDADTLNDNMNLMMKRVARYAGEHFKTAPKPATYDGREMTTMRFRGMPLGYAPSWGVIDGRLVVGLYPQVVAAVMNQIDPKTRKSSITEREDFKKALATMPKDAWSIGFDESMNTTRWLYSNRLAMTAMVENWIGPQEDWDGVLGVPFVDEVVDKKMQSVSTMTTDGEGLLYSATSPFQFGYVQSQFSGGASIATIAILISILLPSLSRARTLSKRTVSAANLRVIGQGCMIYAMDHNDKMPPDLEALIDGEMITPKVFDVPADDAKAPGQSSYLYINGQTLNDDPRNVLVYERPDINDGEGTNILFLDAQVEFMRGDAPARAVRDTYTRLGRENEIPDWAR